MDKFDRIQQLHRIFSSRRTPISRNELSEKLECSEKTIQRAIETLRDYVQAPVEYIEKSKGWMYCGGDMGKIELPGIWFTADEIQGMSIIMEILQDMGAGAISEEFSFVENAINKLLYTRNISPSIFKEKVKYLPKRRLHSPSRAFQAISCALINSHRIDITYSDYQGSQSQRQISPIKLVQYDENWYLDAWCHLREGLRSFMIARITHTELNKKSAKIVSKDEQVAHFQSSYGIFAGKAKYIAKLKFGKTAGREASSYLWHPEQTSEWQGNYYLVSIPYNDDRELVRTILGYGDQVEVLGPGKLAQRVLIKAKGIVSTYDPTWGGGKF